MLIEERSVKGAPIVTLVGDLDRATLPLVDSSPLAPGSLRAAKPRFLLIDMSRLAFADSSVVVLVQRVVDSLPEDGWVGLVGAPQGVLRILRMSGALAHAQVRVFGDVKAAEEAL